MNHASRTAKIAAAVMIAAVVVAACSSDKSSSPATTAAIGTTAGGPVTAATTNTAGTPVTGASSPDNSEPGSGAPESGAPQTTGSAGSTPSTGTGGSGGDVISAKDCATNKAAGTITYLSSFDFSASASIIDVVVAKQKGYFAAMCLDVDLRPGLSTTNYPLVAGGKAQFSSAGNFTEILNFSKDGAKFAALVDYGKAPIEALVTKDPTITDLAQLKGKTIGAKGDIPPSIVAMLAKAGLRRGTDYSEVLLEGFDPVAQLRQDIDALPVYKSNEPNRLDAEGVKYALFDPAKFGVPGSFGIIYTSADYAKSHPTVVAGFTRAALRGMEDAIADPAAAVAQSLKMIDAAGNSSFLTEAGETFRWKQELSIVQASTPKGEPIGLIDPALFKSEYDDYVAAGVWPKGAPDFYDAWDAGVATSMYGPDGKVSWPTG